MWDVIFRQLSEIGVECKVAAPSLIPKTPGDRIKNDRRDPKKLASALRSNDLSYVWVPDEESEALRDLVRARECVVQDLTRAKNRVTKFLLRNNVFPEGINKWTIAYREWLNKQKFNPLQVIAFQEYLTALDEIELRRDRLNKALEQEIKDTLQVDFIKALKVFKGIDTVTAATIACEIGDPRMFSHPRQIMSYLGAVLSEYSSGDKRNKEV